MIGPRNRKSTTFSYDAVGRLLQVTDAAGGIVTSTYDAAGNRTALSDPKGHITSYAYDALNRLLSKTEPGGYVTTYAYDAVGNRTRVTKPNGVIIQYAYDALDRLASVTYPDASHVTFSYDANGNRTAMGDGLGTTTYAYDALDRLTGLVNPFGKTVGYQYDAAGNRTALTYPDGKQVSYAYDALNRLASITDWASRSTSYAYDAASRLTGASEPNGTSATYGYDAADRLTALSHKLGATPFATYAYTLDALGNQTQVTATEPLAPVLPGGTTNYSYDVDNRLTLVNATAQSFDGNGNLTISGADSFSWDFEDRLRQSTIGGSTNSYQYDGTGNRLTRTAGGITTRFVQDVNGPLANVLAETDAAGSITAYYVYGLGLVERVAADGSVRFYHHDSRGSTVALTDGAGNLTDKYAYDPFGKLANSTGSTANPFKYVGRFGLFDEGNGLIYIRARYYNPAQARFLSKDLLSGQDTQSQSLNRFVYSLDNPIRLSDISGLSSNEVSTRCQPYYIWEYGCYGGPNYTGGRRDPKESMPILETYKKAAPIDDQDRAYFYHDYCYSKATSNLDILGCDSVLTQSLDSLPLSDKGFVYRMAARDVFAIKDAVLYSDLVYRELARQMLDRSSQWLGANWYAHCRDSWCSFGLFH